MNSYNSSLTNTYSDRQPVPLSRSERPAVVKDNRPVSELVREGQQLRGEIINRTATDIIIRLSGGQTLQARLDVSVPLSIGQMASFEVTHADPALISLRLLQDESSVAQDALIQKALTAAELPVTTRNTELVHTLLQHNLPISKESIQSLMRQSNTYPDTDLHTLALMTQHKIPVTQATLTQFEAYRNYEHQILPQLANLADALYELATSDDPVLSDLVRLLQRFYAPQESTGTSSVPAPPVPSAPTETILQAQSQAPDTGTLPQNPVPAQMPETGTPQQHPLPTDTSNPLPQSPVQTAANDTPLPNPAPTVTGDATLPSQPAVSDTLPQSPISVADTSFLQPQISVADDSFLQPQVLSQPLLTRWTLSAKDLADPDKVKDFYRQLREDLSVLRSALRFAKEKGATDASLERLLSDTESAAGRLQDNLEFMNMLNRIFPYMQLPLRFSEKLTHGELYVYTKKEKLRNEHGSISVLLHLDMEALGPTDIYLSLAGNRLTSRFYLNDTSLETLFTEHLPELKETLALKGFAVNFELIGRKQEEDPVREFLSNHDNSGLSRFTFDCRA